MKTILCCLLFVPMLIMAKHPDRLCSNNPSRNWWDVQQYNLQIDFGKLDGFIDGKCIISSLVKSQPSANMQIDLDHRLQIKKVVYKGRQLPFQRKGDAYYIQGSFGNELKVGNQFAVEISYAGRPAKAKMPPWTGGFVLKEDPNGSKWMSVACQTEGASIWFPCKNFQGDEAERVIETYIVPEPYLAIGNGRLKVAGGGVHQQGKSTIYTWETQNPINTYDITFYIGNYKHWRDTITGEKGPLTLDFYALTAHEKEAKSQFKEVETTIRCFETKFGPYPFYEDGYKIVEAPFLGMEHQSAIAYGNRFLPGYQGYDISETGNGLLFDYIIVHESAHEWFGNNVTAFDRADNWLHEGFASYAETIYLDERFGKEAANSYQAGKKRLIKNVRAIQGRLDICDAGTTDQYYKAAQIIHMIRCIMHNDSLFFSMLREINSHFFHQLVSSKQVEQLISHFSGIDFSAFFDQYLRNIGLPVLEIRNDRHGMLTYRYTHCVPGFDMPLDITIGGSVVRINPITTWKTDTLKVNAMQVGENNNYLVHMKWVDAEK